MSSPVSQPQPAAPARPSLILAEDHSAVARALRRILDQEFDVLAQVADGDALVAAARVLHPQIIVTDISMPGQNGLDAADAILDSGITARVVFVSVHDEPDLIRRALSRGPSGFVSKHTAGEDLLPAVHAALRGERFLSRALADNYGDCPSPDSGCEKETHDDRY